MLCATRFDIFWNSRFTEEGSPVCLLVVFFSDNNGRFVELFLFIYFFVCKTFRIYIHSLMQRCHCALIDLKGNHWLIDDQKWRSIKETQLLVFPRGNTWVDTTHILFIPQNPAYHDLHSFFFFVFLLSCLGSIYLKCKPSNRPTTIRRNRLIHHHLP